MLTVMDLIVRPSRAPGDSQPSRTLAVTLTLTVTLTFTLNAALTLSKVGGHTLSKGDSVLPDPHGSSRLTFNDSSSLVRSSSCSMSLSQSCGSCFQKQELALHWRYAGTPTESHTRGLLQVGRLLPLQPESFSPKPSSTAPVLSIAKKSYM